MLPRVPARSPPRGSAAEVPRGRAGVTVRDGRPSADAAPDRFTEPDERLAPLDLLTPEEERLVLLEGCAVERCVLVERDTLPDVVERLFCVVVEGRDAVLPEREALPVEWLTLPDERLTLPDEREVLPVERDTLPELLEDRRF